MKAPKIRTGVTCGLCGKKSYPSRKLARHWARILHKGEQMGEYPCEYTGGWHLGHLPNAVRQGEIGRGEHRRGMGVRAENVRQLNQKVKDLEGQLFDAKNELITAYERIVYLVQENQKLKKEIVDGQVHEVSRPGMPECGEGGRQ